MLCTFTIEFNARRNSEEGRPISVIASVASGEPASVGGHPPVLLDWDGCCALGNRLTAAATHFMKRRGGGFAIVSNNSTHLPGTFSRLLRRHRIALPAERIFLAGDFALRRAREIAPQRTLVLGNAVMRRYAETLGITPHHDDPEAVVVLRDTDFSYERLTLAANAVSRGARIICANPDTHHPGPEGRILPETGAILRAIEAACPIRAERLEIVGKPSVALFRAACAGLSAAPAKCLMVGDNPATDIAGARAIGMSALLYRAASDGDLTAAIGRFVAARTAPSVRSA